MKTGNCWVLVSVLGLIVLCTAGVARGQNTPAEPQTENKAAPEQPQSTPAQPAPNAAKDKGPMGWFNLTPEIGYAYLGGQGTIATPKVDISQVDISALIKKADINALKVKLDLKLGGPGGAFELAPFYMLMQANIPGSDKINGLGLYLGFLYSWYIPTTSAGAFYPGVGFGWEGGGMFGGLIDWGVVTAFRVPISCTWYPSKTTPIGIMVEVGLGIQANVAGKSITVPVNQTGIPTQTGSQNTKDTLAIFAQYGFYTDVSIGVRFF